MESNWRAWAGLMDETGSRYGISDKLFSEYAVFVLGLEFLYRLLNNQLLKHDTASCSLPKLQTKL